MGKYIEGVKKNHLTVFRREYTRRVFFLEKVSNSIRNNF